MRYGDGGWIAEATSNEEDKQGVSGVPETTRHSDEKGVLGKATILASKQWWPLLPDRFTH